MGCTSAFSNIRFSFSVVPCPHPRDNNHIARNWRVTPDPDAPPRPIHTQAHAAPMMDSTADASAVARNAVTNASAKARRTSAASAAGSPEGGPAGAEPRDEPPGPAREGEQHRDEWQHGRPGAER